MRTPNWKPARFIPTGVWRGVVTKLDPPMISIPRLYGESSVEAELAVITGLAVGDSVWVAPIEGQQSEWAILARRA